MLGERGASAITADSDHSNLEADRHRQTADLIEHTDCSGYWIFSIESKCVQMCGTQTQASTCLVICIGKLMFAKIVKMQMSKKRQELLALSERPEQVEPWMQWRDLDDLLCFQNSSQFNMKSQAPSWFVVCLHCHM